LALEIEFWLTGKVKDITTSQPAMQPMVTPTTHKTITSLMISKVFGHTSTTHTVEIKREQSVSLNMVMPLSREFNLMLLTQSVNTPNSTLLVKILDTPDSMDNSSRLSTDLALVHL